MTLKTFQTLQDLAACVGQEVAVSDWLTITQEQVNLFAQVPAARSTRCHGTVAPSCASTRPTIRTARLPTNSATSP